MNVSDMKIDSGCDKVKHYQQHVFTSTNVKWHTNR
jgi:hypothetical protein